MQAQIVSFKCLLKNAAGQLISSSYNRYVSAGQTVTIRSKTGKIRSYRILQIHGEMVTLDGNHPLAGQDLIFEIEALEARAATFEEIADAQNPISVQRLY